MWVPFTSESKEAIAHYPEILAEIRLALQEAGRSLAKYTAKKSRVKQELKKRSYIEKYIPVVAEALQELLNIKEGERITTEHNLKAVLESSRGKVQDLKFDASKNTDFDEKLASIGSKKKNEDAKLCKARKNETRNRRSSHFCQTGIVQSGPSLWPQTITKKTTRILSYRTVAV